MLDIRYCHIFPNRTGMIAFPFFAEIMGGLSLPVRDIRNQRGAPLQSLSRSALISADSSPK